jgi:hypothetical protein
MPGARQCRDVRWHAPAKYPHQGSGIRAHVQQATAAELGVIAKIGGRQGWDDELRVDERERAVFGNKPLQGFEMRVIAKHGSLGEEKPGSTRFSDAAFARLERSHRRLVDDNVLAGGERRHHPAFMHGVRQRNVDDVRPAFPQCGVVIGKKTPAFGPPFIRLRSAPARDRYLVDRPDPCRRGYHTSLRD